MKRHIPNFITCLNLFSGCVAVLLAFKGNYEGAFIAVLLSAVFDFLDGLGARLLKSYSHMGKELDSLADIISFGMAPGAIVFSLMTDMQINEWFPYVAFLIPVFSALRLAKFNVDTRQTTSFLGLPVPANAIFWAGIVYSFPLWISNNVAILVILIAVFCYLLISELPMFSLKFKNLSLKDNRIQYLFLIVCIILLVGFQQSAFPMLISWYIILSVLVKVLKISKV